MSNLGRAARLAAAEMMRPKPDNDPVDDAGTPDEPEQTIAEERDLVLRSARETYAPHLLPWKLLAAAVVAGIIVNGDDISVLTLLGLTVFLGIGFYWFTEWRLTRNHVGRGRVEMGDRSSRRMRRVNRRALRSARVGVTLGLWLCLVALTDPAGVSGLIVWTLAAIVWGLAAYKGWWEPAEDATIPDTHMAAALGDEEDAPYPAPPGAAAPTGPRPQRAGRRGGIPVPTVNGQPLHTANGPGPTPVHAPLPAPTMLRASPLGVVTVPDEIDHTAAIQEVFTARNMPVKVVGERQCGPVVTRYTLHVPPSVPVRKVILMAEDLRLACANTGLQVLSPVGNKPQVGVEVPNANREIITLGSALNSAAAKADLHPLLVALGKDADGNWVLVRLSDLVHVLIGGATGGGKSGFLNAIIVSLLTRAEPDYVRLLLIDPKRVELTKYRGIPHLLTDVVTDPVKAANALDFVVEEMEQRYMAFEKHGVRNVDDYNHKVATKEIVAPPGAKYPLRPYAYWVIVIDELADLMLSDAGDDIETAHARLSGKARAAGIHLIDGTQRPSVDVVTGVIKANIPSRLAVNCASGADSKVILDRVGAEKLLGKGDALFLANGAHSPIRLQGAWVEDDEIEKVVAHWKNFDNVAGSVLPDSVLDAPRESVAVSKPTNSRDSVLAAARRLADDRGQVTKAQIIAGTPGLNEKTRDAALTKLFNSGHLAKNSSGNGNYTVPPDAEDGQTTEEENQQ